MPDVVAADIVPDREGLAPLDPPGHVVEGEAQGRPEATQGADRIVAQILVADPHGAGRGGPADRLGQEIAHGPAGGSEHEEEWPGPGRR